MPAREPTLRPNDVALIDALLDRLDAVSQLEEFGRAVAEGLLELIPAISASYNEVNPTAQRAYAVIAPEPDPAWWAYYTPIFERYVHQHAHIRFLAEGGDGAARTWDEVPGGERMRSTELFRQFYAPLGIETQLSAQLPAPEGILVGVSVNRGPEGFTSRDRLVLDLLRSHLVRAYRVVQLTSERDRLGRMLDGEGWQVVLVDDDGRVVSSSLEAAAGFRAGAMLPEPLLKRFRSTAGAPFWASDGAPIPPGPVRLAGVVPGSEVTVAATITRNRVPPHVVHLRIGTQLSPTALRALGLTERQADVAGLVAEGASNVTIARQLGISPATVKKHLEHIYRCLGVSSRAAAVAALTGTVPSISR